MSIAECRHQLYMGKLAGMASPSPPPEVIASLLQLLDVTAVQQECMDPSSTTLTLQELVLRLCDIVLKVPVFK